MKNHLTILCLAIATCTVLVAQGSMTHPSGNKAAAYVQDQQDTSKHKMDKKKWKKGKDTSWNKEKRDTMR